MKVIILFLIIILTTNSKSQDIYEFIKFEDDYNELNGAFSITNEFNIDSHLGLNLPGDSITLFNIKYELGQPTPLIITGDGVVSGFDFDSNTAFFIFGSQGNLRSADDGSSEISLVIEGTPGTGIFKIQWKNVKIVGFDDELYTNFQVWLYQEDQSIEIRIGENNISELNVPLGFGIWHTELSNEPDAKVYDVKQLKGDPDSPQIVTTENDIHPDNYPKEGTVYRFQLKTSRLKEANDQNISVYPNPASNYIKLSGIFKNTNYLIYDIQGNEIGSGKYIKKISIENLPKGEYFIRINHGSYSVFQKFIKK